jgi:L-galactose dehydrogenase/L-glyceraldehyde 3-phosphate reductase
VRLDSTGQRLEPIRSLHEAAIRFATSHPAIGTIHFGMATPAEFEQALAAVRRGPLSAAALDGVATLQRSFAGEGR